MTDEDGETLLHLKYKKVMEFVADGRAILIDNRTARLLKKVPAVISSDLLECGQERAYLESSIDKHPRFFTGGLTRNEHQPAKFQIAKGARVGHQ